MKELSMGFPLEYFDIFLTIKCFFNKKIKQPVHVYKNVRMDFKFVYVEIVVFK